MINFRFLFLSLTIALLLGLNTDSAYTEESNLDPLSTSNEEDPESKAKPPAVEKDPLREKVAQAIEVSKRRYLNGNLHTPWQIVHGLLAYRQDYQIKIDGEKINALQWVQKGQTYDRKPWVEKTQFGGRFHTFTQPWHFEGHPNQFLAILTMSDLPKDFTFQSAQGPVTIEDMIQNAMKTVNNREEITWTLWMLSKYLPPDETWTSQYNEHWSMERLVDIQTRANFNEAACGGTHGLFALAHSRKYYRETGRQLTGVWIEADQTIKRHINIARALQYDDGTFSCGYFKHQEYQRTFEKRLSPTGHTLEFLMMAVNDEQLQDEWIRKGVNAVATDLIDNKSMPVDCGPLYHALSGLVIYLERTTPEPVVEVAEADTKPIPAQLAADSMPGKAIVADFAPLVAPKPVVLPKVSDNTTGQTAIE